MRSFEPSEPHDRASAARIAARVPDRCVARCPRWRRVDPGRACSRLRDRQTPAEATSTSLLVVGAASIVGAVGHWRLGRVRVGPGLLFGLVGIAGSLAGSALNRRLDGDVLLLAFAGLILVAAWRIVVGCPSCTRVGETNAMRHEPSADGRGGLAVVTRIADRVEPQTMQRAFATLLVTVALYSGGRAAIALW